MNKKRFLISLATVGSVAALALAATGAFFSDTETSNDNVLVAGALDLKIDNTCYYNGHLCDDNEWVGGDLDGQSCSCTWNLKDLDQNDLFFDLHDLKPGDWEEDTISLHVFDNDAWACADIKVTENIDNGCTDPEIEDGDPHCPAVSNPGGLGELADELNFILWKDDRDNVLEDDEATGTGILAQGPASHVLGGVKWTLADASHNIFSGLPEDPLIGSQDYFIGKAWCYGKLTPDPVPQDGVGGGNSPTLDPGFDCDGSNVDNISQTDKLMADVKFEAVQSRHNEDFLCNPKPTPTPVASPSPTPSPSPP